jgi:hypothetical protein
MKNQGKMFFMVMVLALAFLAGCETPYTAPPQTETSKNLVVAQQANLPAPSADNSGALYYVLENAKFYYSNGSAWVEIDLTGTQGLPGSTGSTGSTGPQGEPGLNGISITWFGSLATPMASPELNWAYYNTTLGISYIWDGSAWQILAQDGAPGATGPQGLPGLDGITVIWKGSFATHPSIPETNWAYYNTAQGISYIWSGAAWNILAMDGVDGQTGLQGEPGLPGLDGLDGLDGVSISWQGSFTAHPSNPELNWVYYNTTQGISYIYDGTVWNILAMDGVDGQTGAQGELGLPGLDGLDGVSISWRGSFADHPTSPELNWAYYNTTVGISYIWDGSAWQILAKDGDPGATGPQGEPGEQGETGLMGPQGPAGEAGVSFILYTSDTTITASQSPFYVDDNLIVAAGATLSIEAGVEMVFLPGTQFIVEGRLVVSGATGNIVRFKPYTSTSVNSIAFGINATSSISFAEFERVGLVFYNGTGTTNWVEYTKFINSSYTTQYTPIVVSNHTAVNLRRVSCITNGTSVYYFMTMTKGNLSGENILFSGSVSSAIYGHLNATATATLSAVQFSQNTGNDVFWGSTGNLAITASNFDASTVLFLSNSSRKTVNFTNNYFGGLTGAALTAKIVNTGTGSATDTTGAITTLYSPYTVTGCSW